MHPLISRIPLVVLLAGCTTETHDSSTEHATTDDHGSTAHASESSSTHAHHGTDTTTGETGHEHPTEASTDHGSGTSGGTQTPVAAYCECMVINCHDEYHGTWGEDHEMSEAMCEAAAAALPSVGMPAMSGDSIECRTYHCDLAATDLTACASAIGGGSCT